MLGDSEQSYEARTSSPAGGGLLVQSERRRRWSSEDKLRIVRETLEPGAIVSLVARRHDIGTGQLYTWRRQLLAGAMSGFVPVELAPPEPAITAVTDNSRVGLIEIVTVGGTQIRVDRHVDRTALKTVLSVISEAGR